MATPPANTSPQTFAEQELHMVRIVLTARGWEVSDAREDGDVLTIIARRKLSGRPLSTLDVQRER